MGVSSQPLPGPKILALWSYKNFIYQKWRRGRSNDSGIPLCTFSGGQTLCLHDLMLRHSWDWDESGDLIEGKG